MEITADELLAEAGRLALENRVLARRLAEMEAEVMRLREAAQAQAAQAATSPQEQAR